MTMTTFDALSFNSKEEHLAHLYDACKLIVNTYTGSDVLDHVAVEDVTVYKFHKFAKEVMNQIAEGIIK
jgi:hypothetical protein